MLQSTTQLNKISPEGGADKKEGIREGLKDKCSYHIVFSGISCFFFLKC